MLCVLHSYLRGEGCGAIVLVPSGSAKSKLVYATILGTSVMSDGKSASITAPNGSAQKKLIEKSLEVSNLKPSDVDYIECHGTGTAGPLEILLRWRPWLKYLPHQEANLTL